MPRARRIDAPGAWHHVMHRGARRAAIFSSAGLYVTFLDLLGDLDKRYELEIHAYALMTNHYHLLVRSRHGNLSQAMRHLNARYTQAFNARRRFDGALFRGRFRSQLLTGEGALTAVLAYIHLNPLRAGLIARLTAAAWTSHRQYLGKDTPYPWLHRDHLLGLLGGPKRLHAHVLGLHQKRKSWPDDMKMESGWLASRGNTSGELEAPARVASRFEPPELVLERVCLVTGKSLRELQQPRMGPGAHPARRFAVWALRDRTMLTQREIGRILSMSTAQVAHVLLRMRVEREPFRGWRELAWEAREKVARGGY